MSCYNLQNLKPQGLCLYKDCLYYMEQCPITWSIGYISDDSDDLEKRFKHRWNIGAGLMIGVGRKVYVSLRKNCWEILHELAYTQQEDVSIEYRST